MHCVQVEGLQGQPILRVACGASHTLFLAQNGRVFGCGECGAGQLTAAAQQIGEPGFVAIPVELALPPALQVRVPGGHARLSGSVLCSWQGREAASRRLATAMNESSTRLQQMMIIGLRFILMRLQVSCCLQMPQGGEGARAPVVHDVVAGPKLTAFITRGAHELPEVARSMLLQRCVSKSLYGTSISLPIACVLPYRLPAKFGTTSFLLLFLTPCLTSALATQLFAQCPGMG